MKRRRFLKWLGLGAVVAAGGTAINFARTRENIYYSGPVSDHFNGRTFFNPDGQQPNSFADLLKWQMGGNKAEWPEYASSPHDGAKPASRVTGDSLVVTMIGHATLLIQTAGLNILTDPVYSQRASPFSFIGPKRVNAPGIAFDDLPEIDFVLVSHNHYDHLDIETLRRITGRDGAKIITPLGNDTIIHGEVPDADITTGDWGDEVTLSDSAKLHFEPCHHWSARGTRDRRMALWAAFVLETPAGKVYHIGDTGFHQGINFRNAAEKHGEFRLAILPIGAYEPRWFMKGQHMNPREACEGHLLCAAKTSIGHHWGTFQLTDEAINAPLEALSAARNDLGIAEDAFVPLLPGQSWQA